MEKNTPIFLCILLLHLFVFTSTCSLRMTSNIEEDFEQRRACAVKKGVQWLLDNRNTEWGWGTRQEAEAIIALHLADDTWFNKKNPESYISVKQMNIDLLVPLSLDTTLTTYLWSHGKLAHYILGLKATCQDPRNFYGHNLIEKLEVHVDNSTYYFQNNKFSLSLVVLAICESNEEVKEKYLNMLIQNSGSYTTEEASMVLMALSCVNKSSTMATKEEIEDYIVKKQNSSDGSFGDEHTTGLAIQALIASGRKDIKQNITKGIESLIKMQANGNGIMNNVGSVNQILPALAKKSLVDIGKTPCVSPTTVAPSTSEPSITITITVVDTLSSHINKTWIVEVPNQVTLYDALIRLQNQNTEFWFTSVLHSFGHSIESINGISTSSENRTYWSLLKAPNIPSRKGVSSVIVNNGDHYIFKMATY